MRTPTSWDDRSLLEDEPIRSLFAVREASAYNRKDGLRPWMLRVKESLGETDGIQSIIDIWFELAFAPGPDPGLSSQLKLDGRPIDAGLRMDLFIEMFWILFDQGPSNALLALNKKRAKLGFMYEQKLHNVKSKPKTKQTLEPSPNAIIAASAATEAASSSNKAINHSSGSDVLDNSVFSLVDTGISVQRERRFATASAGITDSESRSPSTLTGKPTVAGGETGSQERNRYEKDHDDMDQTHRSSTRNIEPRRVLHQEEPILLSPSPSSPPLRQRLTSSKKEHSMIVQTKTKRKPQRRSDTTSFAIANPRTKSQNEANNTQSLRRGDETDFPSTTGEPTVDSASVSNGVIKDSSDFRMAQKRTRGMIEVKTGVGSALPSGKKRQKRARSEAPAAVSSHGLTRASAFQNGTSQKRVRQVQATKHDLTMLGGRASTGNRTKGASESTSGGLASVMLNASEVIRKEPGVGTTRTSQFQPEDALPELVSRSGSVAVPRPSNDLLIPESDRIGSKVTAGEDPGPGALERKRKRSLESGGDASTGNSFDESEDLQNTFHHIDSDKGVERSTKRPRQSLASADHSPGDRVPDNQKNAKTRLTFQSLPTPPPTVGKEKRKQHVGEGAGTLSAAPSIPPDTLFDCLPIYDDLSASSSGTSRHTDNLQSVRKSVPVPIPIPGRYPPNHLKSTGETLQFAEADLSEVQALDTLNMNYSKNKQEASALTEQARNSVGQTEPAIFPKPKLPCNPPIWAKTRQEVCESFSWFRSYQGGVYFSDNIAKGYLLGGYSSERDIFCHDGRLIISHGGGKSESIHTKKGRLVKMSADDQLSEDKSVRALLNNFHMNQPLVLLADERYSLFPFDLAADGYGYVVLGFYRITYAWPEFHHANNDRGQVIRYKFAFQWCESQGDPWWWNTGLQGSNAEAESRKGCRGPPLDLMQTPVPVKIGPKTCLSDSPGNGMKSMQQCAVCQTESPKIYDQGWMCPVLGCSNFWHMTDGSSIPQNVSYAASFLELLPDEGLFEGLCDLRPQPPSLEEHNYITTSEYFTRGWHCEKCGRLSCRSKWQCWECENCGVVIDLSGKIWSPKDLITDYWSLSFLHHSIAKESGISSSTKHYSHDGNGYSVYETFVLPLNRGKIHLITGNAMANQTANDLFRDYQEQALGGELLLQRYPLKAHKCRGALLSNFFSQNSGAPYQYIGGSHNTTPFERASSAVRGALQLIQLRASNVLPDAPKFNEILTVAYMEKQKMTFHSDNEPGLGPVVASLSLGSMATMEFRPRAQYAGEGQRRTVLTLALRHGDVLVMEGEGVQTFYEHAVMPLNFRIAATARWISPAHNDITLRNSRINDNAYSG